jgi:murein L,D-transpeptidase YafK
MGLLQLPASSHYYSSYAFVVDKAERKLSVWHQTGKGLREVANFPADLGKNTGDKRFVGDHKTPEGIYFLLEQLEGPTLDFKLYGQRAFTTDYPNLFDKMNGKTGYGIWLHAVPDNVPLTRGSRGCVVVRNDVIADLTQYIRLGRTPILIQERTSRVPVAELEKLNSELNDWLESWRSTWERKDLDKYISYYGDEFRALNMNRNQWRAYKSRLNSVYKDITVKISRPAIFADRNMAVIRFLQEYNSDQHSDFGEKVLYLKRTSDGYRIIGETWAQETSQIARQEIEATTGTTLSKCSTKDLDCFQSSAAH